MKISFEQIDTNRNVNHVKGTTSYINTSKSNGIDGSGYQLDIAGKVMENEAYGSQGKTMEAIMQQAQLEDVTVQKNFMTVMSNSVSGEDLKKMQEEGFSSGSTDVDTYVGIVDKIKVTLAQSGVVIAGYNDDLSEDVVAQITGSIGEANTLSNSFSHHHIEMTEENVKNATEAIAQGLQINKLSDGTLQYMVQNGIDPTIENLYRAQFSATEKGKQAQGYFSDGTGYYARKAQDYNWEQLSDQMEQICSEAGIEKSDVKAFQSAMDNSKWLIEQGIPLNAENLERITTLKEMEMPKTFEELSDLVAAAMENGKTPKEADYSGEVNIIEKAEEIVQKVQEITPEAVEYVLDAGQNINIKNLSAAQKQIIQEKQTEKNSQKEALENADSVEAYRKRQLVEVQLMMTVETNVKLLKSGYQLETKNLEQLVQDLKVMEQNALAILFKGTDQQDNVEKSQLFTQSIQKINEIPSVPAAVLGKVIESNQKFTLSYIHKEGTILKQTYQNAGETYEALMTAPRKDMGDSIRKAFQNIDDILEDMELPLSEQNRRAVRILSYNQMQITEENIQNVKIADLNVHQVMQKMTPGATLQMIRDGINPIETSLEELNQYLSNRDQTVDKEADKYAEYLYQLEQNKDISQDERTAYIGVYRLFRQIEKTDGAVIGSLVNQNAEINFKNLLSAVRTQKAKNVDISVGDEFGALKDLVENGMSISDQIMEGFSSDSSKQNEARQQQTNYYTKLAESIYSHLSPEQIRESKLLQQTELSFEELAQRMEQIDQQEYSKAYYEEKLKECQQIKQCSENIVENLLEYGQSVTVDHLLAANVLMNDRGSLFRNIKKVAEGLNMDNTQNDNDEKITDSFNQSIDEIASGFTDYDHAQISYQNMLFSASNVLEQSMEKKDNQSIDIKAAGLIYKQITFASNMAKEENYEIPVSIEGNMTSINLRIFRNQEDKGKVSVTMQTEEFGQIGAEFEVNHQKITGFIACEKGKDLSGLENLKKQMINTLKDSDEKEVSLQVVKTSTLDINKFHQKKEKLQDTNKQENVTTKELYKISMSFIQSLQRMEAEGEQRNEN